MSKKEELLKLLLEKSLISQNDANIILQAGGVEKFDLDSFLIKEKKFDTEKITELKAEVYGISYENLTKKEVPIDILNIISFEAAKNYKIVCFDKQDKMIKVGLTNPGDFKAMEAVNFLVKEEGLRAEYYLISEISFKKVFEQYKILKKEISNALETRAQEEARESALKKEEESELEDVIKSAPVAKIVSVIVRHAVEGRASDIHIEPAGKETRIRYRIDGVLHTSLTLPKSVHDALVARVKVLAKLKLDETRIPQDGRIRITVDDRDVDFRVSTFPLSGEEKVVMRVLDTDKGAPSLENIGCQGRTLDIIKENIKKTTGMFLVTGPTGSGKSTTLFSVLNILNKEGVNISTLEDPIEYFISGVNQSQVRPEIDFTFAGGLRSLLRQDPDIIMVGEIRDSETAELAIHAGLTGHLVLSTLHTNDAAGAIARLVDMKVEPFLLGSTLNVIIAQRLARRICQHCKEEVKLPKDVEDIVKRELKRMPIDIQESIKDNFGEEDKFVFYKGAGCSHCSNLGYSNRVAITEALNINNEIKRRIINGKTLFTFDFLRENQGFIDLLQDGIIKALEGRTTMEEVLRVTRK